jgi:hypothetical protein
MLDQRLADIAIILILSPVQAIEYLILRDIDRISLQAVTLLPDGSFGAIQSQRRHKAFRKPQALSTDPLAQPSSLGFYPQRPRPMLL